MVEALAPELVPLADTMTEALLATGTFDLADLTVYSQLLAESEIYSEHQARLVLDASRAGLVAKSIGGLYNKALVLIGDPDVAMRVINDHDGAEFAGAYSASSSSRQIKRPVRRQRVDG